MDDTGPSSAPLLWVNCDGEDKTDSRRRVTPGEVANVTVTYGPANGTQVVTMNDDLDGNEPQAIEISLNEIGFGTREWLVPEWRQVRFSSAGCEDVVRPAGNVPISSGERLARGVAHRMKALGSTLEFLSASREVGPARRFQLLRRLSRVRRETRLPFSLQEHLILAQTILELPPALEGDVVECGCWNGASTISLSLACALTGRRLFVCDSFEGLPPPRPDETHATHADGSNITHWLEGSFASDGGLEGVQANVKKHGAIEVCHFVEGYFEDTLGDLPTDAVALVYEDADLPSSVESCLRHLWPKMPPGCKFFSDEPWLFDVVKIFYDEEWWRRELGVAPPGFHGSETGLPGAPSLGFAVKPLASRPAR